MKKDKKGFNLAEVLITLTILGVVAAISISSITNFYKKTMTIARLKVAYSMLDNMTRQSYVENGYPPIETFSEQDFKTYFLKYLNVSKYCATGNKATDEKGCFKNGTYKNYGASENATDNNGNEIKRDMWSDLDGQTGFAGGYGPNSTFKVVLKNGMSLGVANNYARANGYAIIVDIDGPNKGDSKLGQDVFQFVYSAPELQSYVRANDERYGPNGAYRKYMADCTSGIFLVHYYPRSEYCDTTRDNAKTYCKKNGGYLSHGMRNGSGCASLIIKDGWKISSDYPWGYAHKK